MTTQRGQGEPAQPPEASTPREGIVLPANGEPWIPEGLQPGPVQPGLVQPVSGQPWGPDTDGGQIPQPVPPAGAVPPAGGIPPAAGDAAETRLIPPFGDAGYGAPPGPPPGAPHSQYVPPPPPFAPLPPRPTVPPPGAPPMPGSAAEETQVLPPQTGLPHGPQPVPPTGGVLPAGAVPPVVGDAAETRLIPPFGDAGHGAPEGALPGVRQGQPAPPAAGLPVPFAVPGGNEPTQLIGTPVPPDGEPYRSGPGLVPGRPQARGEAEPTAPLRIPLPPEALSPEAGQAREIGRAARDGVPLPPEAGQAPAKAPAGMPPGMPGDRRPPAEFDNLFRVEPMAGQVSAEPAGGPADATRPMPAFGRAAAPVSQQGAYQAPDQVSYQGGQQPPQQAQPPYGTQPPGTAQANAQGSHTAQAQAQTAHQATPFHEGQPSRRASNRQSHPGGGSQGRAARREANRSGPSRSVIIGIVVAGCAVTGLAAGAMLSGGGDNDAGKPEPAAPATTPSASAPQSSPAADIAKAQATKLSALLEDSNDSRAAVIRSVRDIRACAKLGKAAADLRAAARQREEMVTRLNGLSVDELPNHQALIKALTTAWKASARADNDYAAWAQQVAGKHGCPGGKARGTGRLARGNAASGEATTAKQRAANLWNPTARSYGLPERDVTQL